MAIPKPTQEYMQKYMPPPNSRLSIFSTILIPCLLVFFFLTAFGSCGYFKNPELRDSFSIHLCVLILVLRLAQLEESLGT